MCRYCFEKSDEYTQYTVRVDGVSGCKYNTYQGALTYAKDVLHIRPDARVELVREVISYNRIHLL